ncbi:zinc finger BED domain-containing 4-like [Brachionus plicatilis]|uniref:Zinc finger BED domain-containing 4-like n=1 Tax=Brachionus plicatilis TaxID=10195 RepID=A0A3M7R6W1_BRAPC|nr:zinc finger BED domain-containing 4-like [Brachionus plicatilis]
MNRLPSVIYVNTSTTELVKHLAEKQKISKLSHENIRPNNNHDTIKNALLVELSRMKFACKTTDVWTSNTNHSYLGVTLHFVDIYMFKLKNRVIALKHLDEDHDHLYLYDKINEIVAEWKDGGI